MNFKEFLNENESSLNLIEGKLVTDFVNSKIPGCVQLIGKKYFMKFYIITRYGEWTNISFLMKKNAVKELREMRKAKMKSLGIASGMEDPGSTQELISFLHKRSRGDDPTITYKEIEDLLDKNRGKIKLSNFAK